MLRAHQLRCAAMIGGYARTAEAQALVRSRWAHDLVAPRPVVRARRPAGDRARGQRVHAGARPRRTHRPAAVDGAAGRAVGAGGRAARARPGAAQGLRARAGLRPLPHHRPLQALHRPAVAARPRRVRCGVPVVWPRASRRCAAPGAGPTPSAPSSSAPAAPPRNSAGHFPAPPSSPPAATPSYRRCRATPPSSSPPRAPSRRPWAATARRCSSTPGRCSAARTCAPPRTRCAAGWRPPRWFAAAATAGWSPSVAESAMPTVQALIRWDPVGHAEAELDARDEVGLPPAVHMAAVDGAPEAVTALLETAELPDSAELLGPVDLPSGARRPPGHRRRQPGQPDAGAGAARRRTGAGRGAATGHRGAQRAARSAAGSGANRPVAHRVVRESGTRP